MSKEEKINRPNLSDEVYHALARRIIKQRLRAGTRLVENEMAEDFGISRIPIREALNRLAQDGLIELTPRKGARVKQLKIQDVEEVYDLRRILESFAIEKAATSIKKEELSQIKRLLKKSEGPSKKRLEYFLDSDLRLHSLFINCCNNGRLIKILKNLHNFINSFRILDAQYEERIRQAHQEHKDIVKALVEKDARRAKSLIEEHIENAKRHILTDFEFREGR
ncbi:MAG: GntR family transcriptional regulator [Candidatus Omnitrophota bacterium]